MTWHPLSRYYRTKHRLLNRIRDVWDRHARRRCCAIPEPGAGGYRFWRCGLHRDHDGPHRFVNYVWDDPPVMVGQGVRYDPVKHPPPGLRRYA